jgi:hypothetical protein
MDKHKQIGADRLAYAVAKLIQSNCLDSRSEAGDALLDYLEIGHPGAPHDVPTWMARYEALQPPPETHVSLPVGAQRKHRSFGPCTIVDPRPGSELVTVKWPETDYPSDVRKEELEMMDNQAPPQKITNPAEPFMGSFRRTTGANS